MMVATTGNSISLSSSSNNLVAVITGAGTGIGKATTQLLYKEMMIAGGTVIIVGRRFELLQQLKSELEESEEAKEEVKEEVKEDSKNHRRVHIVQGSVGNVATWKSIAEIIQTKCNGLLHLLVNGAGHPGDKIAKPYEELDPETDIIGFNATYLSAVQLSYHFLVKYLIAGANNNNNNNNNNKEHGQHGGRNNNSIVINFASAAASLSRQNANMLPIYGPVKTGVNMITRAAYGMYNHQGVSSYALSPILYESEMVHYFTSELGLPNVEACMELFNPLGGTGDSDHIAQLILAVTKNPTILESGCSYNIFPLNEQYSSSSSLTTGDNNNNNNNKLQQSAVVNESCLRDGYDSLDPLAWIRCWSQNITEGCDQYGNPLTQDQIQSIRDALTTKIIESVSKETEEVLDHESSKSKEEEEKESIEERIATKTTTRIDNLSSE